MPPRIRRRVALVGLGIGRQHAAAYRELADRFEIAAVCGLNVEQARAAAAEYGARHVLTDFEQVLALPDIDVVDICTPPHLHASQALAALAAGKHVICEKPIAADLAAIDRLLDAERASGRTLMPIFQYRFGSGLQTLLELQRRGFAGSPLLASVEVHWRRRAAYYDVPWRGRIATEYGGVLTSQSIHAIDALLCAFGDVNRVSAFANTSVNAVEVEDCAVVNLQMRSGALAVISATLGSAAEVSRHRFVFRGLVAESNTRAYSNCDGPWTFTADDPAAAPALADAVAEIERSFARAPAAGSDDAASRLKGYVPPAGFAPQFAQFADALDAGEAPPVTLADARRATELLAAVYHSAAHGAVVDLPLQRSHPAYHRLS
jgi:predicted dehydrogenase